MKKNKLIGFILLAVTLFGSTPLFSQETTSSNTASIDSILSRVEERYAGAGFSVRFLQTSTLKAMQISDTASGSIFVKRPGMMRWEYESPSPQLIIADGKDLWIYRPEDKQVMHGAAPEFFSGGKGANFLSDITRIRKDFDVSLESPDSEGNPRVRMIPKKKTQDVAAIQLTLSGKTYEIFNLVTLNAFGDQTRFELADYKFNENFSPGLFQFVPPQGTEVLKLEQ